jgi:photosystem II stability/assembly factor-like uncharacterized protein
VIAQHELERRLQADAHDLDRNFPRADNLELQILGRVAVTPREAQRRLTWRQELALAGLFAVVAVLLVVGIGRLRSLTQSVPARPTPSVRSVPAPGFRDLGSQSVPYMVNQSDGWMVEGEPYDDLVRTTDGGAHWSQVQPTTDALGLSQGGGVNSYAIDATHAWIVVSPSSTTIVNRTADGGRTWSRTTIQTPGHFGALSFVDPKNGWLLAYASAATAPVQSGPLQGALLTTGPVLVYRTTDGGAHWSRLIERVIPTSGCQWDGISFVSTTTGWMGVSCVSYPQRTSMLFVTHDRGVTWQAQSQPLGTWTCDSRVPIFTDETHGTVIACDAESRQVLLATSDAGKTWELRPLPFTDMQVMGPQIAFSDAMHGWALRCSTRDVNLNLQLTDFYRTDDGGRTWHRMPTSLAHQTGGSCVGVSFIDANVGLAVKQDSPSNGSVNAQRLTDYLYRTTDGGITWTVISSCDKPGGQPRCQWMPP